MGLSWARAMRHSESPMLRRLSVQCRSWNAIRLKKTKADNPGVKRPTSTMVNIGIQISEK